MQGCRPSHAFHQARERRGHTERASCLHDACTLAAAQRNMERGAPPLCTCLPLVAGAPSSHSVLRLAAAQGWEGGSTDCRVVAGGGRLHSSVRAAGVCWHMRDNAPVSCLLSRNISFLTLPTHLLRGVSQADVRKGEGDVKVDRWHATASTVLPLPSPNRPAAKRGRARGIPAGCPRAARLENLSRQRPFLNCGAGRAQRRSA